MPEASKIPHIAIVIPVYNITRFLEDAIRSAAEQDYLQKEIIVVDDGSAPEPAANIERICNKLNNVTLLRQSHAGAACARDLAVRYATSDLIMFLDADDILLPGTLTVFADVLRRNPDVIATYAKYKLIDEHGTITEDITPSDSKLYSGNMVAGRALLFYVLAGRQLISNGAICIRRQALERISPANQGLTLGEDWVLWCHLALSGEIIPAGDHTALYYRRHANNSSAASNILDNPSPLFAAFDTVFTDRQFIDDIGDQALGALHEILLGRIHAQLASGYATRSQQEQARFYLTKGMKYMEKLYNKSIDEEIQKLLEISGDSAYTKK